MIPILMVTLINCGNQNVQFERIPDDWFTIKPDLIGFEGYDKCYHLGVDLEWDFYSIYPENSCYMAPHKKDQSEIDDLIIHFNKDTIGESLNRTIYLRKLNGEFMAFVTDFDFGSPDVLGVEWYSTIDSLESIKWFKGEDVSYKKIVIDSLKIDFTRDFLSGEFFDKIEVYKSNI